MSRTVHHIPRRHSAGGDEPGDPWRAVVIADLRYTAACLNEAARDGHRPRPHLTRRKVGVYVWGRSDTRDRSVSWWSAVEERRERQRLRRSADAIRALVNARSDGRLAIESAEDRDIPPARHRRNALWQA